MYNTLEVRQHQFLAVAEALKKALQDRAPTDVAGQAVPILTYKEILAVNEAQDDPELVEYTAPSVVILQPEFMPNNDTRTNYPVYRDQDTTNLKVKEFPEPVHGKLRFPIHTIAQHPDNDLVLQTFMLRCRRTICELWAKVYPDAEQYDRVVLFWQEPSDYESEDASRVRVYPVDATVHLEVLEYRTRRLINPTNPVVWSRVEYFRNSGVTLRLAQTASPSSTIVYIAGHTRDVPASGTGLFEDGTEFSYTGKTYDTLTGVTVNEGYHFYDEEIRITW